MRAHIEAQLNATKARVQQAVANVQPWPLGHAYLWGIVDVTQKNGKVRSYRALLASVCALDLNAACKLAETVPGVRSVSYNLD